MLVYLLCRQRYAHNLIDFDNIVLGHRQTNQIHLAANQRVYVHGVQAALRAQPDRL